MNDVLLCRLYSNCILADKWNLLDFDDDVTLRITGHTDFVHLLELADDVSETESVSIFWLEEGDT
jgi:hypothetical protein